MHPNRVFILTSQPLFAQGVQSLVSGQPGIQVVGVETVAPGVFAQVQAATPDVVIIEAGSEGHAHLVAQVLESIPGAKVIGLTLKDNCIHTYYQQMKQGRRVEDLLEAIRNPVNWRGRNPKELRLFVLFQGQYGQRILENIRRFAPDAWTVNVWRVPVDLPPEAKDVPSEWPIRKANDVPSEWPIRKANDVPSEWPIRKANDVPSEWPLSVLPASDLILSLGENSSVAQLLPGIVERTGAQAVIAPVDNADWLPDDLVRQLGARLAEAQVTAVFPRPFCSLTGGSYNAREQKVAFDDPWIAEFARHFGCPALRVESDGWLITAVEIERDSACGCARSVARQLVGVDVGDAVAQTGLFHHHYPCLAATDADPVLGERLAQIAGDFMRQAVAGQLEVENR